jgi:hypothetical protein
VEKVRKTESWVREEVGEIKKGGRRRDEEGGGENEVRLKREL